VRCLAGASASAVTDFAAPAAAEAPVAPAYGVRAHVAAARILAARGTRLHGLSLCRAKTGPGHPCMVRTRDSGGGGGGGGGRTPHSALDAGSCTTAADAGT
jgi:hypothetical protein